MTSELDSDARLKKDDNGDNYQTESHPYFLARCVFTHSKNPPGQIIISICDIANDKDKHDVTATE